MNFKELQKQQTSGLEGQDLTKTVSAEPYNTVGGLTVGHSSAINNASTNNSRDWPFDTNDYAQGLSSGSYTVHTPKAAITLKQDFSEADSETDPADLFPDLYKIFNKKIEELAAYVGIAESPFDFLDEVRRYALFGELCVKA